MNSKTKPISSIGEKIADANSVVLLIVHLLLPGKKDVLGQSGTSRLLIRPDCPYTLIDRRRDLHGALRVASEIVLQYTFQWAGVWRTPLTFWCAGCTSHIIVQ